MGKIKELKLEMVYQLERLLNKVDKLETEVLILKAEVARLRKDTPVPSYKPFYTPSDWPQPSPNYTVTCNQNEGTSKC